MSSGFSLARMVDSFRRQSFADFAMGRIYPLIFIFLAFVGHSLGVEVFTIPIATILMVLGLIFAPGVRPLIPYAMTIVFHISRQNSPGVPSSSTMLTTGFGLAAMIFSAVLLLFGITYFFIRRGLYRYVRRRHLFVLVPLFLFAVSLVINGAFSDEWSVSSLIYGSLVAFVFVATFVMIFYGTKQDDRVVKYLSYVSMLVVILLLLELAYAYYAGDVINDVEIVKSKIVFGWGVWNSMGLALTQLIPLVFIGAYSRSRKRGFAYLFVAVLALFGVMFTLSRGAFLVALFVFAALSVFMSFVSYHRVVYRTISITTLAVAVLAIIAMGDRIPEVLGSLFDDNGRFALFSIGIENFLEAPVFGKGFFGFEFPNDPNYFTGADFLPAMAHQTFIELLSATGIVGLLLYLVYRVSTILPLFHKISVKKVLLFASALVVMLMSLVDNFMFSVWPTITYSIALAVMMNDHSAESDTPLTND